MPAYDIVYVSLFSKNMFAQQTKPKLTLGVTKGSVCFDVDTEKKNSTLFILSYCIVFKRVFAREGNYTFKMLLTQVCHITEYFVHFFPLFFFHAVADSKRTMLSFKYFFRKLSPPSKQFLQKILVLVTQTKWQDVNFYCLLRNKGNYKQQHSTLRM